MNKLFLFLFFITCAGLFTNCNDEYFYENNTPEWLGKSIYDYLQNDGKYTNYLRLIDDLDYKEVLSKTGSKTLFVADDEAFQRFYAANEWGVTRYEDLTLSQKKLILNSSMINNALLIEKLSSIEGPLKGQVLRRTTALSVMDTVPFEEGKILPGNHYWDRFRTKGIRLVKDATTTPMVHFSDELMRSKSITGEDFSMLFNGRQYNSGDAYIYNIRIKKQDIVCQNGYIHVLEDVLIPPSNMADVIRYNTETRLFSEFLERFSAPYYSAALTEQFSRIGGTDSVFVKGYLSARSGIVLSDANGTMAVDPEGNTTTVLLPFDPGWNLYNSNAIGTFQTDMGVIFAPSDAALNKYFSEGAGAALVQRYGSVDAIPNEVLDKLVINHMKPSFLGSIPSLFHTITDDAHEKMDVRKSHVERVLMASNGAVYITNTVYPPALYSSVMLPAAILENMRVFNWAIEQLEFKPYLLSMVNYYSFILPSDNFTYIVPTSLKQSQPVAWKLHYNTAKNTVYASVHPYDITYNTIGDSISSVTSVDVLKNHLEDMLDRHIVVGNIENGREFYRTKGGGNIRVTYSGNQIHLAGGGDIERNTNVTIHEIYDQTKETNGIGNGKTYITDQILQTPTRSVYGVLSTEEKFSEFFKLLQGNDDLWAGDPVRSVKYSIFYKDISQAGLDYNVRFLNTFHYTLYVPTNEAVLQAIQNGLPTWDDVEVETDQEKRDALAEKIIRFLRYHFQDNGIFLDKPVINSSYETATLNLESQTFYKLQLTGENHMLNIKTASGGTASVYKNDGLYNIMARDFKFNSANPLLASTIITSSYVVIHQVDDCLYFEKTK